MPAREAVADLAGAEELLRRGVTGLDVVRALAGGGFEEIARKVLRVLALRRSGECLQTSAALTQDGRVLSAVNDPNDYRGPGTGYRLEGEEWRRISDIPQALDPRAIGRPAAGGWRLEETGEARAGTDPREVVIALGPGFGSALEATILGLPHREVLAELAAGIRDEGMLPRVVKIYSTSDCGFIGHAGASLSGSGIAIGLQSKGTTVIHRRDLEPLNNLELFPQAPNLTLESYRAIGRSAARYARGAPVSPAPVRIDNMARLKHIVATTLLHLRETAQVVAGKGPREARIP